MPAFGYKEGKVVKIFKKDGEKVEDGELLAIVETKKATFEMYAPCSGRVKILFDEGSMVPTGEAFILIE
jgi:pyruvate/2-oxoglutarate dehydrogenase complex dihydrolipoamide acyltransferase (E2) component